MKSNWKNLNVNYNNLENFGEYHEPFVIEKQADKLLTFIKHFILDDNDKNLY